MNKFTFILLFLPYILDPLIFLLSIYLHSDMEIIEIKASDLNEKKSRTCNFTSSEQSERGKFLVII